MNSSEGFTAPKQGETESRGEADRLTGADSLVVPVAELLDRLGSHRMLSLQADVPDVATFSAAVSGLAKLEVRLESVSGGLQVTGTLLARWAGACRRCLELIEQPISQELREVFEPVSSDDTYRITSGEVDLEPMVRDVLTLALPIAPLCSVDCVGPAPEDYPVNQAEKADGERPKDPRWAALDELSFDR